MSSTAANGSRVSTLGERGDLHAERGSRPWAVAFKRELQIVLDQVSFDADRAKRMLHDMRECEGWRVLNNEHGEYFTSYEEFCTTRPPFGLGMPSMDIHGIIAAGNVDGAVRVLARHFGIEAIQQAVERMKDAQ